MMSFRIFKHLLPRGRAWRITIDKQLREFFEGLAPIIDDVREFFDLVWFDRRAQETRCLADLEQEYALPETGLTEQQRRDRLEARIKALGGQSPRYIQDSLQAEGFDVYVHEWWWPGPSPVTPRNPLLYLRRSQNEVTYINECGEAVAECGEATAECGESFEPSGYPLVNRYIFTKTDTRSLCGEALMECGEPDAECGDFLELVTEQKEYNVPIQPETFRSYLYIGGQTFPDLATIDSKRREEFEALCLKICPLQLWLGMLVNYS